MKRLTFALAFLFAVASSVLPQNQIRQRLSNDRDAQNPTATRNRGIANTQPAHHVKKKSAAPVASDSQGSTNPAWGDSPVAVDFSAAERVVSGAPDPAKAQNNNTTSLTALVKRTPPRIDSAPAATTLHPSVSAGPTVVYRVGVGDVLDIRLANITTRESTLFTVMKNGVIEYPLIGSPISVLGLTPDEIVRRLRGEIKVIQNPRPIVSVRDYASHSVLITGAVDNPGRKTLRREAVPLFTVLSEALPRAGAVTAVVLRNGKEINVSLVRSQDLSSLIVAGDAIRILATIKRFVYVAGDVGSAGEKELREGMTLTQSLMAAGGVRNESSSKVKLTRQQASGLLKSEEYNLSAIEAGKIPDPLLQPGDRIEVKRSM